MINEAEKDENRNIAIGKDKDNKTNAEAKTQVFKRIAKAVIPEVFKIDPESAGKRASAKWDSIRKVYCEQSARLHQTGNGIQPDSSLPSTSPDQVDDHREFPDCFIPPEGPDTGTTDRARNLWEDIVRQYPYFPALHRLLSSRPNQNPPAITTGVGPHGHRTVYYQAPEGYVGAGQVVDDSAIDPVLLAQSHDASQSPPSAASQTEDAPPSTSASQASQAPSSTVSDVGVYGSSKLNDAVKKAHATIKPISNTTNKRPHSQIEDTITRLSERSFAIIEARHKEELRDKRRRLLLEERTLLLREMEMGLVSKAHSKKAYKTMMKGYGEVLSSPPGSSPARPSSVLSSPIRTSDASLPDPFSDN
ncbi:hypothetical protein CVT24_002830 [Panaeolus cyanescens]|uniref:Uncharacterized protein n=1 Tax=Panaeolus cyanescens TaxID=181874 RepID=A0A409YY43_9AGAR|nr:hypothetical protein CVT24_002830 [Panaeolus cyanescens]